MSRGGERNIGFDWGRVGRTQGLHAPGGPHGGVGTLAARGGHRAGPVPGGPAWRRALRGLAVLTAVAVGLPVLAPVSRAQDPPDPPDPPAEVVVTKEDLDPQSQVLRVEVNSDQSLGSFFDLVGVNNQFELDYANLRLEDTSLTLVGDFPIRVEISGNSPDNLPLRLKLDGVRIINPQGGPALRLTGDSNTRIALAGSSELASQAAAGLDVAANSRLTITDSGPTAGAVPSLAAQGGAGAGIGAASGAQSGYVTIDGDLNLYAEAGGTEVSAAGIGGSAPSAVRAVTINRGSVVAKGTGNAPGIGGIGSVIINGGFISAVAGTPDSGDRVAAVGGLTPNLCVNGGIVHGDTGLANPKNADQEAVYPVYAAPGLADINVTGASWLGQTATPDQTAWDAAHGGSFPADQESAVFWAPTGAYEDLNYTGNGGETTGQLAANVKDSAAPYVPGQWTNVLAAPLTVTAQANGTDGLESSTEFELTFSPAVPGLTIENLELANGSGAAVLGADMSTEDDGATWTVPLAGVFREGDVSLTVTPPADSNTDYAALPMPVSFQVNNRLDVISGGAAKRYATPLAVVAFTSQAAGTYFYRVVDAGDTASIPNSAAELVADHTGTDTLSGGDGTGGNNLNSLVLKGAALGMATPGAKTVYVVGRTSQTEQLTSLYAVDIPAAGDAIELTDQSTAAGGAVITATGPDSYQFTSGLTDTVQAVPGSVQGYWSQLNGQDGLRLDSDPILANGLTGARVLRADGADIDFSQPLALTLRDVALVTTGSGQPGIALTRRANVALNVEGTNTIAASGDESGGIDVRQASPSAVGQLAIASQTGGKLTVTAGRYAAAIGGGAPRAGGGKVSIGGNVQIRATGGLGISPSYPSGAAIGGGSGAVAGQITIGGEARVFAESPVGVSDSGASSVAIGSSGVGIAGNYLGSGDNWILVKDQAVVVANVPRSGATNPAIGVLPSWSADLSVRISGGTVVARSATETAAAIATGPNGRVVITGGSVAPLTANGQVGIADPVDAADNPVYPAYVPAAAADGTDLTNKDIDFGVNYPLHTLTAEQRAWLSSSGDFFPGPASVPLNDPAHAANNTDYLGAWAWLPVAVYPSRAGQAPDYDSAKRLGVDVQAVVPHFQDSRTNVMGLPVDLQVSANGSPGQATSTELLLRLEPALPGLTAADVQLAAGSGQAEAAGDLAALDAGATYTLGLETVAGEGTVTAKVRTHGFLSIPDAVVTVYRSSLVGVTPLNDGEGVRYFTSIFAGAGFNSTWAGKMYYRYGGQAPATAEALADEPDQTPATVVLGENVVPAAINYSVPAGEELKLYVTVKGENDEFSGLMTFTFPAYTGDGWFVLPSEMMASSIVQTVQSDGENFRLTGLTGGLDWLNNRDLLVARVPIEVGATPSTAWTYKVDGGSVNDVTLALRVNGLTASGLTSTSPLSLVNGAMVDLTVSGTNTLTVPVAPQPAVAAVDVPQGSRIHITSRPEEKGVLAVTGGGTNDSYYRGGAGVGGSQGGGAGTISIDGSVVIKAQGGKAAAGIGGGSTGSGGSITIGGLAVVESKGGTIAAGIGGGYYGAGGAITIRGDSVVSATGGADGYGGGAGIGGGQSKDAGLVTINGSASVTATGGRFAAGIGSGIMRDGGPSGTILIDGSASVTATGGDFSAGIGGGAGAYGPKVVISGDSAVTAASGSDGAGIGGGGKYGSSAGGMGEIEISGNAIVTATGSGSGGSVAIGGFGGPGSFDTDFIKITGSPTVLALGSGSSGGVIGGSSSYRANGTVVIEGGFVTARFRSSSTNYAIGWVTAGVKVTGGSIYCQVSAGTNSGIENPVNGDGDLLYPLFIPAYAGGADLTDLDLTAPPFPYEQHTITEAQRSFIAAKDSAAFPAPAGVPAGAGDSAKLAAELWVPSADLKDIELRSVPGFAATVTTKPINTYSTALVTNVLRNQVIALTAVADGEPYEVTSTKLTLTFEPPVPNLPRANVEVLSRTASVTADTAAWSSTDQGKTWVIPLKGVSGQGTVDVVVNRLPAGWDGYTVLGGTATTVNRKQVAELRPGRNWRALEGTAVVGFGSDVEMVDAANPAPKYWYLARPVGDAAPVDGAALKDTVEGLALGDGLGGYGLIRPGAINTATANSVRIYGLPSTSAQVVYVASEHIDPTDDSKSRFSDVIAIPVDAYQEKVSLVATNSDVGPELTLTAIGESTYAVSGATGEFEKINGLALPIADDTLELKGLTGSRHVVADRSDGVAADQPMRLRLNGSTIAVTAGGAPVKVANGANLSIDVVGSNTITNATSGVAAIHVPHGDPENSVTIVSGSGGELVVRQTGGSTSAIGGGVEQGGGNITVGGDLRLTAYSPQSLAGAAIGGGHSSSKTTTAGNIRIQDQAYVKAISTYYNTPSRIGTGGGGSSTTTAGPDQVIITGSPTVHVSTVGGYGNPTVKVEGGFVVASERVFGGDVRITGGSVYAAGGQGVGSPKNAAGDPLYPLYVPAILADGTPLTDLDVGGEGLPYTQHTVTAAQRAWVGSSSLPANFPATMDDLGRFAAVLWVPVPGGPGIIRDIKLGQGPSFAGATLGAARVLAAAPAWSTALANNIVASQVGITSLVANGEADKDTTTALTMTLDRPIPGLVVGELITVAGTGAVTATGLTGGGDTYTVSLADPPKNGQVGLGFANRSYVAPPASVEVYRDQSVRLSVTGPGVRHFTSVGGNFPVESNWEGTVYAQFGGTPPVTAQDVVDNAQATGDLAYGTSVVNAGAVVYGSAADAAIPVYMVAEGTNGAFSGIVLTELPFYAGDPDWFALPAGAFTAAVTATAVDSDVYRLTGMTGGLDWLNGKDLRFGDVPLELGSVFSGARKFTIDGAGLDSSGVLSVRARGLTLTGLYQPFVLQNRAKARLQVDGTNTIASTASSNDRFGSAVTVNPGTSLRITSGSAGTITATGGAYGQAVSAPGIGAVAGSGELTIDGNVVVTASGGVAGTGSGAAGIGSGYSCQANPCTTSPSMGGPVVIGGQAKVYATGAMAGSGIGGYAGANVSASGVTNSVVIRDQALVVARGGATAVGIGGGNIVSAGSGTVNITGGTVAAVPGAATLPAIGGLAAGAVKITGGNVYASNTNAGVSGPVNADGKPVYTLYVPAEFGSTDLTNSHIEAPGWDGSLDTITPEAMEQLEAWGAGTYWATGLAGAAWLTADTTKGLMLHGFTASGSAIMEGAKAARAFIAPQFRTFAEAGTAGYNILTGSGLNELSVSQDGAAGTATTKTLTLSLDEGATLTNAMVSIAPQGPFAASRDVLTAVGGSSGTEYWFRLSGNWAEGDILRVTFQQPTGGANPHVGPLVFDVVLHRDSVQPVLSDPQGTRLSASAGSVSFNASESGEVFYLTLPGDSPEPSADSVKAGQSQAMAAGANTISLNSLSQSGPYKVYILAQDPEGLWSAGLTAVDVPPVYAFSVVVAQDSLGRGSIIDPGSYAAEYPAGTELEIRGSGEPGFAIEYWDDGGADGEFDDAYSQNTVYTMPSGPVTVSAHFGTIVDYRTAEAVDGESGTATTTRVRLTFGGDMPDGFDATFVILPEGMSVTSVDHTGPGEYVITISGVTSQGSIPIRVRRPGAAPVPAIRSVVLYFDSAAPVLAADGWARPAVNEGSVGFTSSEPGTLYYMVTGVGDTAPTASEVAATGTAGPMLEGLNTVALNGSVLTSGAARTVYVVAEDGDGNLSALLPLPLGPFSGLTVEAGEGGTAGASASGLAEGDTTELWATAGPGYQFAGWTVLSGGDASVLLDDPEVAAAVLTMPGNNVTVKALFTKTVLDVVFILNAPAAAEDAPGTGWPKHGSAKIGELVAGTPSAGGLTDYRFTGWHTTVYGVDEADPDKAWVFAEDVVTAAMINAVGGGQVVLYGAWESRWGDVMYAVGGTDAYPASPAAVGPDRVEVGSVVVDAPGYSTVLSRPGFTFGGWYLDSEFVDPVTDTSLVTAGGVDLHAYWVALEDVTYHVKHYLVAHDASRQLAATETLQGRPGVMSPEATARDFAGYVFNSADSEVQGTISAGMVLELVYDAVPVAVVFTPGAGSSTEPWTEIGYFYGDLVSEPDDPSWAGHAFLGWESSQVGDWAFAADRLTQSNGVALADGVAGQIGLSGVWAGGPEAQGAETMVALGGTALLEGSVDVDTAHEVTVEDAKVTTEAAWLDVAEVTPGLDGSVVFAAKSLEAGVYAFTVRFEDSNGLTADAVYSVTVVAPPQVSGKTAARIPEGGEAGFELVVESVAAPLDVEATAVPPGADVEAEVPGADGAAAVSFAANDLVGGVYEFWVTYTDKLGQASSGTKLVVTVQAAPTGQGRNTNLADDREVGSVTPLDDVTGTNLEELTNESFTATEHGTLVLVDGGVIEYTPDTGWEGIDEFTVTVCDDLDQCVELDYSFTVLDVYVAPVAPQVTGAQGVVRVGGKITLAGQVEVDPVYGPAVVSAELVTVEPWMDRASIELDVAGSVEFGAGTLPVGEYTFTVRFTDSNGLFGDAAYTVTVMDRPLVTGLASARIAVGGQAQFELDVADGVTIGSAVASRVPDGDGVEVLADDAGGVLFRAGSLEAGTYGFDVTYADGVDESTQVVGFTVVIQAEPTGEGKDVQVPNDLTPVTVDPLGDTTGEYLVPLTAGSWSGPDKGSLALVGGKVRYTPLVGWMGTDEFTVTVCDDLEQCVELTYTVSVLSIWSPLVPPEAIGAEDVVALGGTVVLDGHVTPDTAHAVTIDQAELVTVDPWVEDASVEVFASGEVRFDAGSLEPGVYEFVVRYTDSESATVDATFKVEVIGLPTVSGDGALTVALGGTGELGLTVGSRVQIDSGTASDVPEGLGVTVTASGQVRVDAGGLPAGQYEFLVSFTDELGQASEPFPVEVSVQAPPQGQGRVFEVADDLSAVAVDVAGDVSGTGLISLTAGNITQPVHGKVLVTGSLAVSYVPAPGWAGQDPFTVRVCDGVGQCVDLAYVADVLDTVAGPVLPIIAIGASGVVGVGGAVELVGAVHADGEHGVTVTGATVVVGVAGAGIVADVAGRVLFNAGTAAAGTYEFTVRFTDSAGQQADAVYRVAVVDALLVSGDTSARVPVGGSHVFRLAVEDSATLADVTVEGAPADGSVTAGADGNVEFEAGSVAEGVYGFRVKFTDELNQVSQVVAFEVTVQGPPVAATDTERAKVRAGGRLLFPEDVSSRFGWVASRSIVTPPAAGTAKLGSVIYDATGAAAGEYPFVVEYTDDLGQSARVTYIPVVQWAPSGTGRRIVVPDDRTPVLVDVFGDVTGAGLRALSAGSITQADHGVVTVTGVGQVRYLPALGWSGATSFSVQVCDDLNQCVTLTYAVDVKSVKPLPPCVPDTPDSPDSPSNPGGSGAGAGAGAGGGGSGVPGDELPFTGFDVWAVMGPALDLVIAGILLLLAARVPRRRRRA